MNLLRSHGLARRRFIHSAVVLGAAGLWLPRWARAAAMPNTNPTRDLRLAWTDKLRWDFAVDITSVAGAGEFWDERLEQAQRAVVAKGGGVVFFPAGTYRFAGDIKLHSGAILRGSEPEGTTSAREEKFSLPSKLEFPKYTPGFTGSGTPVDAAFKGIVLADPATAANCGVVHLALNRGCITFAEADGHRCGANRLVFGCVLRNAAGVMAEVPNAQQNQPAWLRYTHSSAVPFASTLLRTRWSRTTACPKAATTISRCTTIHCSTGKRSSCPSTWSLITTTAPAST